MINDIADRVLNGSDGNAWVNGELWSELKSIEFKITAKFEDVNVVGQKGTGHKYTGWDGSGTLTNQKVYSRGIRTQATALKTGKFPDTTIITKVMDSTTGKAERWALKGVKFTEIGNKIEAKNLIEQEMPFTFADYEILETIDE